VVRWRVPMANALPDIESPSAAVAFPFFQPNTSTAPRCCCTCLEIHRRGRGCRAAPSPPYLDGTSLAHGPFLRLLRVLWLCAALLCRSGAPSIAWNRTPLPWPGLASSGAAPASDWPAPAQPAQRPVYLPPSSDVLSFRLSSLSCRQLFAGIISPSQPVRDPLFVVITHPLNILTPLL